MLKKYSLGLLPPVFAFVPQWNLGRICLLSVKLASFVDLGVLSTGTFFSQFIGEMSLGVHPIRPAGMAG
jgi:hypothetical protein